jgi:DHA2 family multidrug resistance protein-like MFS transporter
MPSTLSLISNMFRDDKQRTVAIAVWSTSLPLGGVVGPLIGGAMLQVFWWGAVFLLAVPVMVTCWRLGRSCCRSTATQQPAGRTSSAWACPLPRSCQSSTA